MQHHVKRFFAGLLGRDRVGEPSLPECPHVPDMPTCFASEAPWRQLGVDECEFASRVELTKDQCVVDEKHFFIRGHIELPIHGSQGEFVWSVWCSLSHESFLAVTDRWNDPERANDPPRFGWLCTDLPGYEPRTLNLKTMVHQREPGRVPWIEVQPGHPLANEQNHGISVARWHELVRAAMASDSPGKGIA